MRLSTIILTLLLLFPAVVFAQPDQREETVEVLLFTSVHCRSCQKVKEEVLPKIKEKYKYITYNIPKLHINTDFDIDPSEGRILASTLKYSDVLVNMFSTVNLEGSIMNIPLVNVCFNGMCESPTGNHRHQIPSTNNGQYRASTRVPPDYQG